MAENSIRKTKFVEGEGLKIPVIDMSLGKKGKYLSSPETLRNSMLELLFEPEELESLAIVKPDKQDDSLDPLKKVDFGDGIHRIAAFSSGNNVYYAKIELARQLIDFFKTQPDHACRYGSLLVSSCNRGAARLDRSDGEPLRIKIVNSQSNDPTEKEEAARFHTGDCHGKISPQLAKMLGGRTNRPFQFRFAWRQQWDDGDSDKIPNASFLAKGTFLPNKTLTTDRGYDLILDKSSIKGFAKERLDQLIPCGDYELPKAILGNRDNALAQEYENSWQMSIWYSEKAIQKDIVPPTLEEAQKLASLQKDPLKLARYLVEQHDSKAALAEKMDSETDVNLSEEGEKQQRSTSRLISLLRQDQYGQLLDFPKVADFLRDQLASKWRDLAIKGAVSHGSAMAQPCDSLKPGTIVAPHIKHGTEVIVTRYPIVSKDNIRRYTVDNKQKPELLRYRGCAFIRPDQAMQHHQCDFDGDQLVVTPAKQLPSIAAETRHANSQNEFKPVQKRKKIDYTQALDPSGSHKYTKMRQIAVAVPKNSIGYIATLIGRVQSSVPQPGEPTGLFFRQKRQLLGKLFDALQIEVDSPKSATRFKDIHPDLNKQAKQWTKKYPSHLFDFKKDERLYKTLPLPDEGDNPINAIAREAVNPAWEPTRIRHRHRDEFRYLFPPPEDKRERASWEKHYLAWAFDLKERAHSRRREIHQLHRNDVNAIKEEYGKLYEDFRSEIAESFHTPEERKLAAAALWHVETTSPNLSQPRRECAKLSRKLNPTFELEKDHQRLHSALPQDTYILSIPFQNKKGIDLAETFKEAFDKRNIEYSATLHPTLPMVQFALLDPSEGLVKSLKNKYGKNDNYHLDDSDLTYRNGLSQTKRIDKRIVAPANYTWLSSIEDQTPKSALVLNLFTEEICAQLQQYQFDRAELTGQKYNDYKNEDFNRPKWQEKKLKLEVSAFDNPGDRRHGFPIVQLDGKNLAMFSVNSAKLPIGATFEATINSASSSVLTLDIDPESVQLPLPEPEPSLKQINTTRLLNRDIGTESAPRNSRFNLNEEGTSKQKLSQPTTTEASKVLHLALIENYQQTGQAEIQVTPNWTAIITPKTQNCLVKNENNHLIFSSNLKTGEILKPLSKENSRVFDEMILRLIPAQKSIKSRDQVQA